MRYIFLLITLSVNISVFGQTIQVNAIINYQEEVFTIVDFNKARKDVNRSITIKNSRAAQQLKSIVLHYDDFQEIIDAEVEVINPSTNKIIDKYKLKDFEDVNYDFFNLASDARQKRLDVKTNVYPFQINYSYSIKYNGLLHYPIWFENQYPNTEVTNSVFKVIDKTKNTFRFKRVNIKAPNIREDEESISYTWIHENIPAKEYEILTKKYKDFSGFVITSPNNFLIDGYSGRMNSWENFGNWISKLNENKNDLNINQLEKLNAKLFGAKTRIDTIQTVYDFLQSNSRYISIQLGIGGWQPLNASFVHDKKYGDCKALSNYTKSILDLYNIKSYYTLINGGSKSNFIMEDFASPYFNHAILTVPIENDTIYLECTSQTNPFAYMGTFTSDRLALLVKENGSKLIKTKKYNPEDNIQTQKTIIELQNTNKALVTTIMDFEGLEIENHNFLSLYQKDSVERTKWINNRIGSRHKKINRFNLKQLKEGFKPKCGYEVAYIVDNEIKTMGKRLFIDLSKHCKSDLQKLPKSTDRHSEVNIEYGYTQVDSIVYKLPKSSFKIENLKETNSLKTKYGSYSREIRIKGNTLFIIRRFMLNDGDFPASEYNDFKEFTDKVLKFDNERVVIVNVT